MKFLIPLDGSELAERALETALVLARKCSAEIHAVRVINPFAYLPAGTPEITLQYNQVEVEAASVYLESVSGRLARAGIQGTTQVAFGHPIRQLVHVAESEHVGLIILSSQGRSGVSRWLMGSVAEGILRQAPCPTLLCRGSVPVSASGFARVLVPVDGSPGATAVIGEVEAFLAPEARLTLLRTSDSQLREAFLKLDSESYRRYLAGLGHELDQLDPDRSFAHRVMDCDPSEAILKVAQESDADLIAMATHGRTGLGRVVLGSVTERVARHAACPVMGFPPGSLTDSGRRARLA